MSGALTLPKIRDGQEVFTSLHGASTWDDLGNQKLADLLRGRWDEIRVEQLGEETVAVIEADEVATMLRLTLPEDLKAEIEREVEPRVWEQIEEALLTEQFGSKQAFQQAEAGL